MSDISQILSVSYPAVVNERGKAANQWAENALLREMERQKMIDRISFGTQIEHTLDYQANAGAEWMSTDLDNVSLAKTEVLTAAQYTEGILSVPIVYTKADEAKNPSTNQKIALVKSLLENAFESHDEKIEIALFGTTTSGFLGFQTLIPDSGQGTVGGINAASESWWRNYSANYKDDGTDLLAALATAFNTVSKGTGGSSPTLLVSDGEAQALYEGTLQDNQRWVDAQSEGRAGFKTLAYKTARYVFSQHGNSRIYGMNPRHLKLRVSKDAYRKKGEVLEIPAQNAHVCKIFSMLQATTNNKSRVFVLTQTAA
jgi:hypothetical protein